MMTLWYNRVMKTITPETLRYLPATRAEMQAHGWDQCDVILISGDAYIDSPFIGVAVVGRILEREGYRVGIIAQPDINTDDVMRLGEPKLFWGVRSEERRVGKECRSRW